MRSGVGLCVTPWTVACQATLSIEVSRQEYFSGLSFPPPGRALSCKQETLLYSGCLKQKRDLLMGMRQFEYLWKGWRTKHRDKLPGKMPKIYLRAVPEDKPLLHVWAMMLWLIQMMPPTLSPKYYHQSSIPAPLAMSRNCLELPPLSRGRIYGACFTGLIQRGAHLI